VIAVTMKCFIAMAFSRSDTDALYDGIITKVLIEQGITPVRIDRIEHNGNIDDRMIEEITTANFVLADLTYARPSVYYEAGFAERVVPVIYTIRRDHLSPRVDDEFGMYRLHFDLAMRNVIDWVEPGDQVFASRLAARINQVTAPLRGQNEEQQRRAANKAAFLRLSINEKCQAAKKICHNLFTEGDFQSGMDLKRNTNKLLSTSIWQSTDNFFKIRNGIFFFDIHILADDNEPSFYGLEEQPHFNLNIFNNINYIQEIEEYKLLITFQKFDFLSIVHKLPDYNINIDDNYVAGLTAANIPVMPQDYRGEVCCGDHYHADNIIQSLLDNHKKYEGFRTKSPPLNMPHWKYGDDQYFVHSGFRTRPVNRHIQVHLIDDIQLIDELSHRVQRILDNISTRGD
jgi:hypothetical protein